MAEDLGQFCRDIETHLTRVNGGHLVRIVGPGFALVRQWHEDGIPMSVVMRGIDAKAERHRTGHAQRPLRIEFCEPDVRHLFAAWRRAVGLAAASVADGPAAENAPEERRRKSLTKHLDRSVDRLTQVAGRLDLPDHFRDAIGRLVGEVTALRAHSPARGAARDEIVTRLAALDGELLASVRTAVPDDERGRAREEAERELAAFRERLPGEQWQRSVAASVDRLLRDRLGLPTLEI